VYPIQTKNVLKTYHLKGNDSIYNMTYLKKTGNDTYERTVNILDDTYTLTIPSHILLNSKSIVCRHIKYWISKMKQGNTPVFKYGTVDKNKTTDTRKHYCQKCDKTYKSRSGLLRHIKKYHPSTETKEKSITEPLDEPINERTEDTLIPDDYVEEYEDKEDCGDTGYVYCFYTPSMKDVYKIGMTCRNVKDRLDDANKSSTWKPPEPYQLLVSKYVKYPKQKEKLIHTALNECRIHKRREFFKTNITAIKAIFKLIPGVC
jgi:uncharacterized C2H2 Zn-finger protein